MENTSAEGFILTRGQTSALKFCGCLMIAMTHYSGYALSVLESHSLIYKAMAATFGYCGVALFFFLSGYGLTRGEQLNPSTLKVFFGKRIHSTYMPAVLVSVIWLLINVGIKLTGGGVLYCCMKII